MLHTTDYFWFTNYVESDILWLDESLNWDESMSYVVADYLPLLSLTSSHFANTHHSTDWLTVTSFIEPIFVMETLSSFSPLILFLSTMLDSAIHLSVTNGSLSLLLHADYQDWVTTLVQHTPELIMAMCDWNTLVFSSNTYNVAPGAVFDIFQDTPSSKISEFVESFVLLITYTWLVTLVVNLLRIRTLSRAVDPYVTRIKYYFFSYACESRLQLEAVMEAFFLAILFLTMMIITFDDDREELIEFFNLRLFYLFLFTFMFHAWKHSIHYLSFLDASRMSSSSVTFILGQFLFDMLNLFGFALRFVLLMMRLNIYDGVDDILDSYYIAFVDFDEDEYFLETFPNASSFSFFDTDVQDDRSFMQEDESDLIIDLYTIYAVLWGKYVFYLSFILEEFARVGLALFVTYILMFEINAVNRSRNEDFYFAAKR